MKLALALSLTLAALTGITLRACSDFLKVQNELAQSLGTSE